MSLSPSDDEEKADGLVWFEGELIAVRYVRADVGDDCPICGEVLDMVTYPHEALGARALGLPPHPGWPTCRNDHRFPRPKN